MLKRHLILFLLLVVFTYATLQAQPPCGFDHLHSQLMERNRIMPARLN